MAPRVSRIPDSLGMTGAKVKVVADSTPVIVEMTHQVSTADRRLAGHPMATALTR